MDTTTASSISLSTNVNKRQSVHAEFIRTFGQHNDLSGIIANETLLNFFVQTLQELLLHIRNDNAFAIRDTAASTSDSGSSSSSPAATVSHTSPETDTASTTPTTAAETPTLPESDALPPQAANNTERSATDSDRGVSQIQHEQPSPQPAALANSVNLSEFLPEADNDSASIVARTLAGLVGNFAVYPENVLIDSTQDITIEDRSGDTLLAATPPPQYVDPNADYRQQWWL